MNKLELICKVAEETGETKTAVAKVISSLVAAIKSTESVTLAKFGKFTHKQRAERIGHNIQTGERIIIPAKVALVFKSSI